MINLLQKNSKKQGDVGLGIAIGYFAEQGFTVCIPLTDSQSYDLLVDIGGKIMKVQVKTTRHLHKSQRRNKPPVLTSRYTLALRTIGGNRSGTGKVKKFCKKEVDYIFAVTGDGKRFFIPSEAISGTNSIVLGAVYEQWQV